ncbi:MAG: PqiC family protein [Pseudoruegeria sp.]
MNKLKTRLAMMATILGLAACSGPSDLYLLPEQPVGKQLGTAARTVEVETIDLPDYAKDTGIALVTGNGILRAAENVQWADSPDRAMTLVMSGNLDQALTAQVAASPWPFNTQADVLVVVKVAQMSGTLGSSLRFSGQYFLTSPAGGSLEKAKRFNISVPIAGETISALADAQSKALAQLATDIAAEISRVSRNQL